MGAMMKLIDGILLIFFIVMTISMPLLDAQICLAPEIFPQIFVQFKDWYVSEYGDYLISEKPLFMMGIVWLQILFLLPLSIACIYAIIAGKSWFRTTCLMHGVSTSTAMVTILSELKGSGRASETLLMMYYSFTGFAFLSVLRGLLPHSGKSNAIGKRPALVRKKKA